MWTCSTHVVSQLHVIGHRQGKLDNIKHNFRAVECESNIEVEWVASYTIRGSIHG
jgi:hypothetical protein